MCAMIAFIIIRDSIPHAYNAEFALSKYSIVLKSIKINITKERNATIRILYQENDTNEIDAFKDEYYNSTKLEAKK